MYNPKLILLSKAKGVDGELLFPDLTNDMGFIRPDIMSHLIAACRVQKWGISFDEGKDGPFVDIVDVAGKQYVVWGPDDFQNTISAMVKATKALEPDNWVECPYCDEDNEDGYVVFDDKTNERINYKDDGTEWVDTCAGTGIVIMEVTNGN